MKYLIKTPQGHYLIGQRVPGGPGERPTPLWSADLQAAQLFDSPDAAFAATVYMQAGFVYEAHTVLGPMAENPNKTEVARFPQGDFTGKGLARESGGAGSVYSGPGEPMLHNEHVGKTGGGI